MTKTTEVETEIDAAIQAMSFEDAMAALDDVVRQLESGQVALEKSIALYSKGTQLKQHCQNKLKAAQAKIEKLTFSDGKPSGTQPLDAL